MAVTSLVLLRPVTLLRGISPGEIRIMLAMLLALASYGATMITAAGVPLSRFASIASLFLFIAVIFTIIITCFGKAYELACHPKGKSDPNRFLWLCTACLIAGLTIPAFGVFKQLVLPARGFPFDPLFAAADRLILGTDPWRLTHYFLGGPVATIIIDQLYSLWLYLMFAFPMLTAMFARDAALRARLIGTWLSSWFFIGTLGAWLLGSAGPVYYDRFHPGSARFVDLNEILGSIAAQSSTMGWEVKAVAFQKLLISVHDGSHFAPAGGISAMPSMHVAMAVLFAIAATHADRRLGCVMWAYAFAIWVGSVHLGWHYALDGVLAAAMMLLLWRLSRHIFPSVYPGENLSA